MIVSTSAVEVVNEVVAEGIASAGRKANADKAIAAAPALNNLFVVAPPEWVRRRAHARAWPSLEARKVHDLFPCLKVNRSPKGLLPRNITETKVKKAGFRRSDADIRVNSG